MKPTQIFDLSVGDRFMFQGVEYVKCSESLTGYQSVPCLNVNTGQTENFNPLADVLEVIEESNSLLDFGLLDFSHVDDFDGYVDNLLLDTDAENL